MEYAIFNEFKDHFPDLDHLFYVHHISKREEFKLTKLLLTSNHNPTQTEKQNLARGKAIIAHRKSEVDLPWLKYLVPEKGKYGNNNKHTFKQRTKEQMLNG